MHMEAIGDDGSIGKHGSHRISVGSRHIYRNLPYIVMTVILRKGSSEGVTVSTIYKVIDFFYFYDRLRSLRILWLCTLASGSNVRRFRARPYVEFS